jgi:hypothetical protein
MIIYYQTASTTVQTQPRWQGYRPGPRHPCRGLIDGERIVHCVDLAAVDRFLEQAAVRIVPITAEIVRFRAL